MNIDGQYEPKQPLTKQLISILKTPDRYRATVKKLEAGEGGCDVVHLDFEVVGLCQYPDCDIRAVEPIKVVIGSNIMPAVFLERADFPPVPHMNVHKDSRIKSICYSDQTYEEIRHKLNARFLLECINSWFVKTARSELHRTDQPLEPFFLGADGIIILNVVSDDHLFMSFEERYIEGQRILLQTNRDKDTDIYALCVIKVPPETKNILHRIPDTLLELTELFPEQNIKEQVKSFVKDILNIRHYPKEFMRLFAQSTSALFNCRTIILMDIPLARSDSSVVERNDYRVFVIDSTLGEMLADFGYPKKVETKKHKTSTSYPYDPAQDMSGKNIKIKMFMLQYAFSSRVAQILNQCDKNTAKQKIVQIGAGALGSQIFLNAVRAGIYRWSLIDNDRLWPHNLARHTLTQQEIGEYKVISMAKQAQSILPDINCEAITEDYFSQSEKILAALESADLIIDASASMPIERHLALDVSTKARKVSFFLNPSGNSTIMLLEDADASVRLDLLEMQYYHTLLLSPRYEEHLKNPESIAYSVSCRDVSGRISQDDMALSASLCNKALKQYTSEADAKVAIWTHSADGVVADMFEAEVWEFVDAGDWKVYIRRNLLDEFIKQRLISLPNETGGVLIGSFDYHRKILYIVHQIESPDDSISSPTSYIRGCNNLESNLNRIRAVTQDNLFYVGEWHSHPSNSTARSSDDDKLFSEMVAFNRDNCRPSCMLILGGNNKSLYVAE